VENNAALQLLEDALVLTLDADNRTGMLSVALEDGIIADIGDTEDLRARFPHAQRTSCAGRVIMPGLVNAHLHPELHILKGSVEELGLHGWKESRTLQHALAFLSMAENAPLQRAAVRASLAECLLTGTTTVACYGVSAGVEAASAEAFQQLGIRGHITLRDVTFKPPRPGGPPHMYRLHAEETLTVEELTAAAAAHARGHRIVMHAAETEHRVALAQNAFGVRTIELLERFGLLSERVLLSHCVHIDDRELGLLALRHACVISSPTAEMKLGDGIARIAEMVDAGVTVALGTDCAICNNSSDMFREMRQLGLVQKLKYGPETLRAEQILRTATGGGAAALGEADARGQIVPGMAADLVLIDVNNLRLQPLMHRAEYSNLAANLVYAATGQDVTDVMVGGGWVVRKRRLLTADMPTILVELASAATNLYDRILE
jgi:5-methylthioadenosine/S-adenosylhomocysteine deaminase